MKIEMRLTQRKGQYDPVCDIDDRPDKADRVKSPRCGHVHVHQPVLQIVPHEGRDDVRDALGETEHGDRQGTSGHADPISAPCSIPGM